MSAATDLIEYPCSDGKPMAETDMHRDWMFRLIRQDTSISTGSPSLLPGSGRESSMIARGRIAPRLSRFPVAFPAGLRGRG